MSELPAFEIDEDGYPTDECLAAWKAIDYLDVEQDDAARFLLGDFLALDGMGGCCSVTVEDGVDERYRKPEAIKIVRFSTGGWSGAEDAIEAVIRLFWVSYFHTQWKRGGHYWFEVPAHYSPVQLGTLAPADASSHT